MTRDTTSWDSDPAVEAGFAAAYAEEPVAEPWSYAAPPLQDHAAAQRGQDRHADVLGGPGEHGGHDGAALDAADGSAVGSAHDSTDEGAGTGVVAQAVPLTRDGLPARAPAPEALSPVRALAGAAVAVAGVALGIGTLLWVSGAPEGDPVVGGPVAQVDAFAGEDLEAVAEPAASAPAEPVPSAPVATAPAAPPAAAPPAPAPAAAVPSVAEPAPAEPAVAPLTVLNNSRVTGLADRAAARFRAAGWPVRDTGNLRGRIRATTVYYAPGQQAQARALARSFPGIERVLPRLEGLPGSGLTVVVTRDFAA